jgi:dihydroorotate dehydrogenase electron transfer subunit
MLHILARVLRVTSVAPNVYVLAFHAPELGGAVKPGQFVNILAGDGLQPLLRRPFSVYRIDGDAVEVIFQRVGKGTAALSQAQPGGLLDVIGPLGAGFHLDDPGYHTAILVGGGLGVAPLPLATAALRKAGKRMVTLLGARTAGQLVEAHLENVHVATDDGTRGLRGTVVDLAAQYIGAREIEGVRLFGCGPTPMLRALAAFARAHTLECEVSLEGQMACGIGLCQGCPVELTGQVRTYALMCKDGPVFNTRDIVI